MRHFALFTGCWQCCPESRESPRLSALFTGSWQHWPPALFTSSPLSAREDYILASVEMNIQFNVHCGLHRAAAESDINIYLPIQLKGALIEESCPLL